MDLRKAFRAFSSWLTQVYRIIKGDLDVKLDNEIRQVFDRMLATEEQIAVAEGSLKYKDLFTDAAMAGKFGMTAEEFEAYQARGKDSTGKAEETLRDKLLKELTRKAETWWKDEVDVKITQAEDELKEQRVYRAVERLKEEGGAIKLDRAMTKELLGIEKIPPVLRNMTITGALGATPDDAAAFLGYASGDEMLQDIMTAPKIKEVAAAQAQAEMLQEHGDIMNDGSIDTEATKAAHNAERGNRILEELKILSRNTRRPAIDRKIIKQLAEEQIGKLSLQKIRPANYHRAEVKAAQQAVREALAGNTDAALVAKTQQALNFYLWTAAIAAHKNGEKILRHARKFSKKSIRTRLARAGNQYLEQMDGIMSRFELRISKSMLGTKRDNLETWARMRAEAGDNVQLTQEVLDESYRAHWKEIPYDVLLGIHDSLVNLDYIARFSDQLRVEGELVDWLHIKDAAVRQLEKLSKKYIGQRTHQVKDTFLRPIRWMNSNLTKVPWLTRWMDGGKEVGLFHRLLTQPFTDAFAHEQKLWEQVAEPVMKAMNSMSKAAGKRASTKYFIRELKDERNDGNIFGSQIINVALNTGNFSNLRKMLIGEGWAADDTEVSMDNPILKKVLAKLTKEEWDLVQLIWDQLEILKKPMAEVYKRTSGIDMATVEATEVVTEYGTYRGGYYPMKYDTHRDVMADRNEAQRQAAVDSMFDDLSMMRPVADTGAKLERTAYTGPVMLSMSVIPNHIQDVVHYVAYYEAVSQVHKILSDKEIEMAIKDTFGRDEFRQMKDWLNAIAKAGREAGEKTAWEQVALKARLGTTLGVMGFKASTGLVQTLGIFNAVAEVGSKNMASAVYNIAGHGWDHMSEAFTHAMKVSKVLPYRLKTMDREIYQAMQALEGKSGFLAQIQELSMKHIAYIQLLTVDLPTWYAAYEKGMQTHADLDTVKQEKRALQYADWVVDQVQGSGVVANMSQFSRSNKVFLRFAGMFMTFFSSMNQALRDTYRGAKDGRFSAVDLAAKALFILVLPNILEMWMRGELEPEAGEDEWDVAGRMASRIALYPTATVPFVRDLASGVVGDYGFAPSPVWQVIEKGTESLRAATGKVAEGEDLTVAQIKNISSMAAIFVGLPGTSQGWASGKALYEIIAEGEDVLLRELVYGPKRD